MKRPFFVLVSFFAVIAISQPVWAAFSIEELVPATKVAVEKFTKDNPEHVAHFSYYKVWKLGDDARVRVNVDHDGVKMDFNYLCHKHDESIECHVQ